ncbi:histidine phosphatase family protein [Paenibacillus antri]|uniref:Histidine phosphatase family protein n=1 Tax=Paenibacillus antri TaxID=2582848 RepID=A0A5R9G934_9BACL|nr:histidine phosphatase family protein [Paenibacillus antri]TLS51589.1 histidine phosphatase family protein [Paenibacillus antri]
MIVGLVRHYPVDLPYPSKRLVSGDEAAAWFAAYDEAPIVPGRTELGGIAWERCVSSDQPRAVRTAELLFPAPERIETRAELREIALPAISGQRLRLPFLWWAVWARLTWKLDSAAREEMASAERRVQTVLDEVANRPERSVLIVSHGALMLRMKKELAKRGFQGPRFAYPRNGELYVFTL